MQKFISVAATLLLAGSLAAAQNGNGSQPAPSNDQQQRGSITQAIDEQQNSTITGCLQLAEGTYWLSDEHGKSYRLSGNTEELARLSGHQVRIAGNRAANDKSFAVTNASDVASTCTAASEPMGTRISNAPYQGSQGGTPGPPENWHRGNTGNGVAQTAPPAKDKSNQSSDKSNQSNVQQSGGIAAPSNPYQAAPEKAQPDRDIPNPPLDHARPEDQTPSVGTPGQTGANASGAATETSQSTTSGTQANTTRHKKHHRKHNHKKSANGTGNTSTAPQSTPPPQL